MTVIYYKINRKSPPQCKIAFRAKTSPASGDLYIGNTIVLYARSLKVLDYGDKVTRETCSQTTENTLGLVKPEAVGELGQILTRIRLEGIKLARARMVHLTRHQAERFYSRYRLDTLFEDLGNCSFCHLI